LSDNTIGVEGFLAIIESFQYLEEFDLKRCGISIGGMETFGEMLAKHDKVNCKSAVGEQE